MADNGREGGSWPPGHGWGGEFGGDDRSWIDRRADENSTPNAAREGSNAGKGPQGAPRLDEPLRALVCGRLRDDPLLDAREIDVQVIDGVVVLTGVVHAGSDLQLAEMLARGTPGAGEVRNYLVRGADEVRPAKGGGRGGGQADLSKFHF